MSTRGRNRSRGNDSSISGFLGEWWAGLVALGLIVVALPTLLGAVPEPSTAPPVDPRPLLRERLVSPRSDVALRRDAMAELCTDPVLAAVDLRPDCESGTLVLPDDLFEANGVQLSEDAIPRVDQAIAAYLGRLRRHEQIWKRLEAIEFRGHSDPRAVRDPFITNLVGSQHRPLALLLHLFAAEETTSEDREDLQRLAIVSASSFSRPPAECPERSRECYALWRRVEVRLVFAPLEADARMEELLDDLEALLEAPVEIARETR